MADTVIAFGVRLVMAMGGVLLLFTLALLAVYAILRDGGGREIAVADDLRKQRDEALYGVKLGDTIAAYRAGFEDALEMAKSMASVQIGDGVYAVPTVHIDALLARAKEEL